MPQAAPFVCLSDTISGRYALHPFGMLLSFSDQQLDVIAREHFLDRVTAVLIENGSGSPQGLRSADGRRVLREQFARAQAHGLASEQELATYLITAWLLGTDFDTRYPAMQEILATQSLTPARKAEAIERVATTYLETLAGRSL